MSRLTLFDKRPYYKPFQYQWAYDAFEMQHIIHWLPADVSLQSDVDCWNNRLNGSERNLLTQLFRFFTQADIDIASGYVEKYMPIFPAPEIRMMLTSFAAMEGVHIQAYSLLLETIGMPEAEYKAFQEYEQMAAKHDYFENIGLMHASGGSAFIEDVAERLAIYSAFGEGLQLFSSFAILMNFPRHKKMIGMGKIVEWSIRDESLHIESMIRLFHTLMDEYPKLWKNRLKARIYQACRDMVDLEFKFIELAFEQGGIENLSAEDVKQYVRYIADRRLLQLGLKPEYKVKKNPLEWLDELLNQEHHTNFFENSSTEYSQATTGDWNDVWSWYDGTR